VDLSAGVTRWRGMTEGAGWGEFSGSGAGAGPGAGAVSGSFGSGRGVGGVVDVRVLAAAVEEDVAFRGGRGVWVQDGSEKEGEAGGFWRRLRRADGFNTAVSRSVRCGTRRPGVHRRTSVNADPVRPKTFETVQSFHPSKTPFPSLPFPLFSLTVQAETRPVPEILGTVAGSCEYITTIWAIRLSEREEVRGSSFAKSCHSHASLMPLTKRIRRLVPSTCKKVAINFIFYWRSGGSGEREEKRTPSDSAKASFRALTPRIPATSSFSSGKAAMRVFLRRVARRGVEPFVERESESGPMACTAVK
jgi:hypothetical protein